ncbi:MAG: hypothetical protein KAY27_00040 [Pedobacter sp.]|nr:hypothetical protein [Pedobacter sp.]
MIPRLALLLKNTSLHLYVVFFFIPKLSFSQNNTPEKLIEACLVSDVYQTKKFADACYDLIANFNEKRFRLQIKESQKYLSTNENIRLKVRLFLYERFAYQKIQKPDTLNTHQQYRNYIKLASLLNDEQLLSELYSKYAAICIQSEKLYYLLKSIDIREHIGLRYFPDLSANYYLASEILYGNMDYKSSARYAARGVKLYSEKQTRDFLFQYILATDLAAASYLKINQPDSAIYYYINIGNLINDRLSHPKRYKSPMTAEVLQIWKGVVNGGLGNAYKLQKKYNSAYSLLIKNLKSSIQFQQWGDVAEVQISLAEIDEKRGSFSLAHSRYLQAYQLALKTPNLSILTKAAKKTSSFFAQQKQYDSAYVYHTSYLQWKDQLDKKISQSRLDMIKAQVDFEMMEKTLLQSQTNLINQKRIRNAILIAIILLTGIALLLYNRKSLLMRLQNEKLEKEKQKLEVERIFAQQQIDQFIKNIAEKNNLINQLQTKIVDTNNSEINSSLSNFTILTEEDWEKFKDNFETINPNFLYRLRQKMPQITIGEQRIILLAKLGFNTKEMANATGVSSETIRSVSSRMRKKFNLNADLHSIANDI